jgi:hypothetical protein
MEIASGIALAMTGLFRILSIVRGLIFGKAKNQPPNNPAKNH